MKEKKEFSERSKFYKNYFNIMTSGKYPNGFVTTDDVLPGTQYLLMNALIIIGGLGMTAFSAINFSRYIGGDAQSFGSFLTDFILVLTLIPTMFIARLKKVKRIFPSAVAVGAYFILCWVFGYFKLTGVVSPLVYLIQPLIASYLLGIKLGGIFMIVSYGVLIYTFATTGLYSVVESTSYLGVLTMITSFSFVTQNQLLGLFGIIADKTKQMQEEHKEMKLMKDSLSLGVFFLNKDYEIQPMFSKPSTEIFDRHDLENLKFRSLFEKNLQSKELGLLVDFLDMVYNSNDANSDLLKDINPLQKVSYVTENLETKILSFTFTKTIKNEEILILTTVEDITYEAEMEEKLKEEEQARQEEMNVMFEIMHAPNDVLEEYIEDAEYEFDIINENLKDSSLDKKEKIEKVFQSVHAMKSNALITGLETTGKKLHKFENTLTSLLKQDEIEYEDMLGITFTLNDIIVFNDRFREMIDKITNFSKESSKISDKQNILTRLASSTLQRALKNTEKQVSISILRNDWSILSKAYRRSIKDILVQLIRNSVSHAFELPEEREQKGKDAKCKIKLSVSVSIADGEILVDYSDDGKGIDYNKIYIKAKELGLTKGITVQDTDKLTKIMMSPAFSTSDEVTDQAGRGVGMSLVADKLLKHKGKLAIKTEKDKGTKFVIKIPLI